MKLNKKFVAINVLATFLMAESAMAKFETVRPKGSSGGGAAASDTSTGPTRTTEATRVEGSTVEAARVEKCDGDMDSSIYFPQELFGSIARDEGAQLDIRIKPGNKVSVKIPSVVSVCGDFTPVLKQNSETKSVSVLMKLIGSKTKDGKTETGVELTYKDFLDCLTANKILKDGKINLTDVKGHQYADATYEMSYQFDKKADAKKTATVSFGFPTAFNDPKNGFSPLYGYDERETKVAGISCMRAEKVDTGMTYINKGRDVLLEEINVACANQDVARIAELRRSLGNADALSDIADKVRSEMDVGYLNAVLAKDVKEINAKLTALETEINKNVDTMPEDKAKKKLAEYAEQLSLLDKVYLNPAIARLEKLIAKRADMPEGSAAAKAADEEIKKLNEGIGQVATRSPASLKSIYFVAAKYALTDSAKTIEDIRLKSDLFRNVTEDERNKDRISFEEANKRQEAGMVRFEKSLVDWTDTYLVGKGNMAPIQKTEKERQNVIDRMNKRYSSFQQKEMTDYNSYCATGMLGSVKNPIKCREHMAGQTSRMNAELKRRDKDLSYIKGRNEKLNKMGVSYNEHQRKVAAAEEAKGDSYDPTNSGSSFSPYDDTFSERFPMYNGPSTSTAYDPSMYNMGGQSAAMGMGQQQMMMPQMQMQQGQYQMPQMGQMGGGQMPGAWPSM